MARKKLTELDPLDSVDSTDLVLVGREGVGYKATVAALSRFLTEELTSNRTLTANDSGKMFYTLEATSSDISLTVPGGLGNGFWCMWVHTGTGTLTVVGDGVTVEAPPGGTLVWSSGYGSLTVAGEDELISVQGTSEAE